LAAVKLCTRGWLLAVVEVIMSFKALFFVGSLLIVPVAAHIDVARAAETGTKTLPDSSIYPPATPAPVFGSGEHYMCYLPSEPCDNSYRVEN
jgi:hypothetical protein